MNSQGLTEVLYEGTLTATANGTVFSGYGAAESIRLQLEVTARSGTSPTLDVIIQDSMDGTNWYTVGTFAQKTNTGTEAINITTPVCNRLRVRATLAGTTPSFTFSVKAVARVRTR